MSSLQQRRESPRRRTSSMHPGWACFMCALGSGLFGGFGMLAVVKWAMLQMHVSYPITFVGISFFLFIIGGKKAERLWERP
jgi:hypothetical protein